MDAIDYEPRTTTVLTIDLPTDLGERLRLAIERDGERTVRTIALEALEAWLERDERAAGDESADPHAAVAATTCSRASPTSRPIS